VTFFSRPRGSCGQEVRGGVAGRPPSAARAGPTEREATGGAGQPVESQFPAGAAPSSGKVEQGCRDPGPRRDHSPSQLPRKFPSRPARGAPEGHGFRKRGAYTTSPERAPDWLGIRPLRPETESDEDDSCTRFEILSSPSCSAMVVDWGCEQRSPQRGRHSGLTRLVARPGAGGLDWELVGPGLPPITPTDPSSPDLPWPPTRYTHRGVLGRPARLRFNSGPNPLPSHVGLGVVQACRRGPGRLAHPTTSAGISGARPPRTGGTHCGSPETEHPWPSPRSQKTDVVLPGRHLTILGGGEKTLSTTAGPPPGCSIARPSPAVRTDPRKFSRDRRSLSWDFVQKAGIGRRSPSVDKFGWWAVQVREEDGRASRQHDDFVVV